MGTGPAQLTDEQVAELRSWAEGLLRNGASGDLETFARAIGPLSDEAERLRGGHSAPRTGALATLRREARAAVENGASDEVRAAARAVLFLCDDIDARRASARARDTTRRRRTLYAIAGGAAFVALAAFVAFRGGPGGLDATGPDSALVGRDALSTLAFAVAGDADDVASTTWSLDGEPVSAGVTAGDGRIVFRPRRLADGEHRVDVSRPGGAFSNSRASWTFTVDTRAPAIRITKGSLEARRGAGYKLRGAVEPAVRLRVNGRLASVDEQGRFEVPFARTPTRTVVVLASDRAGNVTDSRFKVAHGPTTAKQSRACRACERRRLGARRAPSRRPRAAAREAHQHRRARSQGRARHRRLALGRAVRAADRRRARDVRPRRGREAPPRARREGGRPPRCLPGPCPLRVGVDARPKRPRDPDARRRRVLGRLRRVHELRPSYRSAHTTWTSP